MEYAIIFPYNVVNLTLVEKAIIFSSIYREVGESFDCDFNPKFKCARWCPVKCCGTQVLAAGQKNIPCCYCSSESFHRFHSEDALQENDGKGTATRYLFNISSFAGRGNTYQAE